MSSWRTSPIWQLFRAYSRSEGQRLVEDLRRLKSASDLLEGSLRALRDVLPQTRPGGIPLRRAEVPSGQTESRALGDFERTFHGFFAAARTLDASMRSIAASAPRRLVLSSAYDGRRDELIRASSVVSFASQLGEWVLATGNVPWITSYRDVECTALVRVDIYRDDLRRLRIWRGAAREFVRGPGPDVDPDALAQAYASTWAALCGWFVERTRALHRAELAERKLLWDQLWWELRREDEEGIA